MKLQFSVITIFLFISYFTYAEDGKNLFDTNCKMCHSIGGGKIVGPDLKGISEKRSSEWFVKFAKDSKSLIDSGDEQAIAIFEEYLSMPMPPSPLNENEIASIYKYIVSTSKPAETTKAKPEPIIKGDAAKGEQLFYGSIRFAYGGVACVACHTTGNLPGGTLAKSLTHSAAIVKPMMDALPFPAMRVSYKNNKLIKSEISDLTAYIEQTSKEIEEPQLCLGPPIGGFLGFIIFMVFLGFYWKKRKKESVNKNIYDRQI
jgi:mono/diheme cytochrome c family protein